MSFCRNCGKELKGNEKFCSSCGSPVSTIKEDIQSVQKSEGKKKIGIIVAGIVIIIAMIIAAVFALGSGKKEKEYNTYIETAEKYLEEKEYEQAVAAYMEAIQIDAKKLEPYVEVAEIYIVQKEYVNAKEILELAELNNAQGTEEEEQIQMELSVLMVEIFDDMILDEQTVLEMIDPVLMWLLEQFEGFEELTPAKKVEIASIIAHENKEEEISNDGYHIYYSKDVMTEVMKEYFGEVPAYDQVENTDMIRILDDQIELYWPARGYQYWYSHEVDEIKQQEDGSYKVKVTYILSDSMLIGDYEYYQATYTFRYDHTLERGFYIASMKLEKIYKGEDYVEELIANGGFPSANTYVTTVNINLETGEVTEEWGDTWTLELPGK